MRVMWMTMALGTLGCLDGGDGNDPARTCDDVEPELEAELDAIQACEVDADCGQALAGTSCGCTRNLVAATDADPEAFYELLDEAQDLECEISVGDSPCDCPETAGFLCDDGTCAWNYVDAYAYLPACTAAAGDPFTLQAARLEADELVVDLQYSGGCEDHAFTLCWPDQSFLESSPVQVNLEIFHDDPGDKCDAKPQVTERFDLSPLEAAFEESYQSKTGEITINVGTESLSYTF